MDVCACVCARCVCAPACVPVPVVHALRWNVNEESYRRSFGENETITFFYRLKTESNVSRAALILLTPTSKGAYKMHTKCLVHTRDLGNRCDIHQVYTGYRYILGACRICFLDHECRVCVRVCV